MRRQHKQIYDETTALLRQCGGVFRHYMQMSDAQEAADAALLDDLAAQGIDMAALLAAPDAHTNWHHHATRGGLGALLPEDAPYRAEVTRLAHPSPIPAPAPAPAQQQADTRTTPLESRGGPVGDYFARVYGE
jgi:hypothetical protein